MRMSCQNVTACFFLKTFCIILSLIDVEKYAYAKTKMQISFAVSAKLISAFVFAT